MRADLLVTGRVATLAGAEGFGWVSGVAISGGSVVAAGDSRELASLFTPSRRLDLAPDEIAIPGFTDAHLHLGDAALAARQLDLRAVASLDEALDMIAARHAALPEGEWLRGFGWQAAVWGRLPAAADLERVAPGRPAFLWSHDHHAAWLSAAALERAGIVARPGSPAGVDSAGIRRDGAGHPTGVLHEDGVGIGAAALPRVAGPDLETAIEDYGRSLAALGVLAVHDPGPLAADPGLELDMAACVALAGRGRLPVRVHVSVRPDGLPRAFELGLRSGDPAAQGRPGRLPDASSDDPLVAGRVRVGWLKLFADGALGSRTAALLAPYQPEPGVALPGGDRGMMTTSREELIALVGSAAEHGIASQIHAIGDAAVRSALDAFEAVGNVGSGGPDAGHLRGVLPRIEHAQLVDDADMPRFARLGVVASVQPTHLGTDAPGALRAWGVRAERGAYAYGSLHRADAVLAFGSDAPVEAVDPWASLAFAMFRAPRSAQPPLLGATEGLAADVALRAACLGPAAAAGEPRLGSLVPGSPADLSVAPADAIREPGAVRAMRVIAGGRELA